MKKYIIYCEEDKDYYLIRKNGSLNVISKISKKANSLNKIKVIYSDQALFQNKI